MVNAVGNIVAGRPNAAGGAYRAPLGSTLPTDSTTALDVALLSLGFIGDAGLVETVGRTTNTVKAWGGDIVKVLQTDFTVTYQVTLIESLSSEVAKAVAGDANVTVTAASASAGNLLAVKVVSDPLAKDVWVFDVMDGLASVRVVLPEAQVTTVGDVTYSDGAVVAYPVTIQAFPDSSGVTAYRYSDDGQTI
ncbi:MAG: hypothetical protein ACRDRL_28970 [Sciscionella sp.]